MICICKKKHLSLLFLCFSFFYLKAAEELVDKNSGMMALTDNYPEFHGDKEVFKNGLSLVNYLSEINDCIPLHDKTSEQKTPTEFFKSYKAEKEILQLVTLPEYRKPEILYRLFDIIQNKNLKKKALAAFILSSISSVFSNEDAIKILSSQLTLQEIENAICIFGDPKCIHASNHENTTAEPLISRTYDSIHDLVLHLIYISPTKINNNPIQSFASETSLLKDFKWKDLKANPEGIKTNILCLMLKHKCREANLVGTAHCVEKTNSGETVISGRSYDFDVKEFFENGKTNPHFPVNGKLSEKYKTKFRGLTFVITYREAAS